MTHAGERVVGVVEDFDARRGLGTLAVTDGRRVGFHATQFLDGSREVAVGTHVGARLVRWHGGALEATELCTTGLWNLQQSRGQSAP